MKLYKFRPLNNCQDLCRLEDTLETGRFWCSYFWELNDPMEGVYSYNPSLVSRAVIDALYSAKSRHVICSFSGQRAFSKPIMWGYYANGFKGVAIEIEVDDDDDDFPSVSYDPKLLKIPKNISVAQTLRRILTTKLKCWKHEQEYRYLSEAESGSRLIGRITGLYFGSPYKTVINAIAAQSRRTVREYLCRARALERVARHHGISCHGAEIRNGKVSRADLDLGVER